MKLSLFIVSLLMGFCVALQAENRVLLVGIGKYPTEKTGWNVIHGDADVELLAPMLQARGFTDIRTLVNRQATKDRIVTELKALAERCQVGDKVYFHFSGHGQPIEDINDDEATDFDESMIPYDAYRSPNIGSGEGYEGQNHLIDDEYNPLLNAIKEKIGTTGQLFVAIDACYSKGMERGEETDIEDADIIRYIRGTDDPFIVSGRKSYLKNVPKPKRFTSGARLIVVSACLNTERNYECKAPSGKMYGSLSYYIYTLLKTDADFLRWEQCFESEAYRRHNIFQTSQHPTITVYD